MSCMRCCRSPTGCWRTRSGDAGRGSTARLHGTGGLMLLRAQGITAAYGDAQALFGIDLNIAAGEVVALIGSNGAGKSSFLKTVTGLLPPRSGSIHFDGQTLAGIEAGDIVKRGIALVPEERRSQGISPLLSVLENLTLAQRKVLGRSAGTLPIGFMARKAPLRCSSVFRLMSSRSKGSPISSSRISAPVERVFGAWKSVSRRSAGASVADSVALTCSVSISMPSKFTGTGFCLGAPAVGAGLQRQLGVEAAA
eukprot:gene18488-26086_t